MNIKKLTLLTMMGLLALSQYTYAAPAVRFKVNRPDIQLIQEPDWLITESSTYYDGDTDDLVTAGIGFTPLSRTAITSTFNDPKQPTLQELRKAKLNRYINTQTGEGSLYGFKVKDLTPLFDGKVAGTEIQALIDKEDVGLLLQIPLDFDKNNPCIVAVPATDSDGLYNAKDMQIRGLWGLRHNCAVVYNDKGLGNGIYDITGSRGYALNGKTQATNLLFSPQITNRSTFIEKYPNRYAVKQLHSKQNPEEKWGNYVLKSIEFAFYELNMMFSPTSEVIFNKENTLVLVYGNSDGGGAALKAGEQDKDKVIDGIVAVNPQIQPLSGKSPLYIQYDKKPKNKLEPKSIADYSAHAALYLPCAVPAIVKANPDNYVPYSDKYIFSQNRCDTLKQAKLLTKGTPEEALQKLHQYGWTPTMDLQLPYFYYKESIGLPYQYISAYGKYDVTENMCDYSVASTWQSPLYNQGEVKPLTDINFEQLWAESDGHLPLWLNNGATALDLVNNSDPKGPRREFFSTSKNAKVIDYNTQGAICLQKVVQESRVKAGMSKVTASGNLNNIKTFIIHGSNNVKQLPNYTSRAYVALNSQVEGKTSQLRYIEVENASYLDSVIPFDNTLLPMEYYGESAMNWLWANLTKQATLPESQVVRAKARGGKSGFVPAITTENLVPIMQSPSRNDIIRQENGTIILPN